MDLSNRNLIRIPAYVTTAYACALLLGTHWPKADLSLGMEMPDKVLHLAAYAGLAILCRLTWLTLPALAARPRTPAFFFIALLTAGAIDELTQIPIPGRQGCVYDWLADAIGIGIGLVLFGLLMRHRDKAKQGIKASRQQGIEGHWI